MSNSQQLPVARRHKRGWSGLCTGWLFPSASAGTAGSISISIAWLDLHPSKICCANCSICKHYCNTVHALPAAAAAVIGATAPAAGFQHVQAMQLRW
jgi:hypothetical protein